MQAINPDRWNIIAVGITPDGQWVPQEVDPSIYQINDGQGHTVVAGDRRVALLAGSRHLMEYSVDADGNLEPETARSPQKIDVVFPLLHGAYGEDGTLQGLLELTGIPYAGCGVASSAVAMDKALTKAVLHEGGLPVGQWVSVSPRRWNHDRDHVLEEIDELGLPVFVKPCRAGSSQGVIRVTDREKIPAAIAAAADHDPRVIVEAAFVGREVECGVLQRADGTLTASPLGEIVVSGPAFYDYETKYFAADDDVTLTCPADLPEGAAERIRDAAVAAFETLECEGLARVDFFYDPDSGEYAINEVNTLPGFTPFSMYPTMMGAAGVSYEELIEQILEEALGRKSGLR